MIVITHSEIVTAIELTPILFTFTENVWAATKRY